MKKASYLSIIIGFFIVATVFYSACTTGRLKSGSKYPEGQFYNKPYDLVWNAVHELIFVDLGCAEKSVSKKKGAIETEWVTQITTEGIMRWKIEAEVKAKGNGTQVYMEKRVEKQDEAQKTPQPFKKQEKDPFPNAGWKRIEPDPNSIESLYQNLSNKLKQK